MEFPSALLGVALGTILLPSLAKAHADTDSRHYSMLLDWGLRLGLLLAAPSAVALLLYAEPMIAVLYHYGHFNAYDVAMAAHALSAYGIGLIGIILIKVLAPGFYARQDIKTPVKIGLIVLCATQMGNLLFVPRLAHTGLSLSIGLGACLNAGLLFLALRKKGFYHPSPGWRLFSIRLMLACTAIAGLLLWLRRHFDWLALQQAPFSRVLLLIMSLATVAGVYFGILWLTGMRPAHFLKHPRPGQTPS
jgi:putative peptidoglycan lipid II flippase